jgi:hypothetical protein
VRNQRRSSIVTLAKRARNGARVGKREGIGMCVLVCAPTLDLFSPAFCLTWNPQNARTLNPDTRL